MNKTMLIISNAIIWGAVILACSITLRGSDAFRDIQAILASGGVVSMLILAVSKKQTNPKVN